MRVYFLPLLKGANPYMSQLVAALDIEGVEVCGPRSSNLRFLPEVVARRARIVHLHWLWGVATRTGRARSWLRLALFIAQLALARFLGRRIVYTAHNLRTHDSANPDIDLACTKSVIRLSHRTIVHANAAKHVLRRELGLSGRQIRKIVTIPHGHYADWYPDEMSRAAARRRLDIPEEAFVFSNFGMLRPYKGILGLIDAFQRIEGEDLRLIIAGRPIDEAFERAITLRASRDLRITLHPRLIPDEEVQIFVKGADVMVYPFEEVLSSGSVILGLSFGRTCVAPATGCIPDLVSEEDGYLYAPSAPGGLVGAMRAAIADRRHCAEKGLRGRERVLAWSWTEIGHRTAALYRELFPAR